MTGYEVGARFRPAEDPTGIFGRTDAQRPPVESMIDDVVASSGMLPLIVPDFTKNVSKLIGALGDAAELAGKMQVAGDVSRGSSSEAASREAIPDHANPNQSAVSDTMSAIFAAKFAGSVMSDGTGGKIPPSEFDYGKSSVPDTAGLEVLDQTRYFGQRSAQLELMLRNAGSFDFSNESDSDGRMSENPLEKLQDLYANSRGDLGEGIESGDALVLGALTGGGLTRSDEATAENRTMLKQNDERMFGSAYGLEQTSSQGESEANHDLIETEKDPTGRADFSGPEREFYPFIRERLSGDGIQDFAVHDILRRAADGQKLIGVGTPDAGTMMLAPSLPISNGDETPSDKRMPELSGLWGMLRDAERILPKPSLVDTTDDRQAVANEIESRPSHLLDMLHKLVATDLASHRQKDDSSMSDEKVATAGGRSGPTGHRNDPIYTVAISSMTGTLMPLVPTPGSSTRSPPIPGQRNLP